MTNCHPKHRNIENYRNGIVVGLRTLSGGTTHAAPSAQLQICMYEVSKKYSLSGPGMALLTLDLALLDLVVTDLAVTYLAVLNLAALAKFK